ncbi:hypothetical protein A4A49_35319 [Nicotiana attenuata]|uniref:DUF4218 domain-containing protein n=2 Tax=Nicotiana attenuata TaxID=49451 RepID=A0A314KJ85_NICAT|nr:hypothetical protein A4A49_35319 [Nicotiana attenuata]
MNELEQIDGQIPKTECKLEKVFPPTFFDVMEHLPIHLANEAKIAGPIQCRWMYPMERYIYFLKPFIRNRACAEGSIAEGYLAAECMTLCSRYLHTMETKFNRLERNYDGGVIESDGGLAIFYQSGRALRGGKIDKLDSNDLEQAHFYILENNEEVQPFLEEFSQTPVDTSQENSDRQFISWLKEKVARLQKYDDSKKMADLLSLSRGPTPYVTSFRGYIINGYRFHMLDYDKGLRTQNCGVVVVGETDEENKNIDFYGELTEILELQFVPGRRVVLFRCTWFDVYDQEKGVKIDEYGFADMDPSKSQKFEMVSTSKTFKHAYVPPGALARGRGKSFRAFGSVRVNAEQRSEISPYESEKSKQIRANAEQRTLMGKNKNNNAVASNQNKLAQKDSLGPPGFDPILEYDASFSDEEAMQGPYEHEKAKKVRDKFDSDNINNQRDHVLKHMRKLWNNWRGSMHKNIKSKPFRDALREVPEGVDESDWKWLVKEHFLTEKFKETSTRNSINRSKLTMPHRTGSKPIREIMYELGGKDGNPPDMATIFFETRRRTTSLSNLKPMKNMLKFKNWCNLNRLLQTLRS